MKRGLLVLALVVGMAAQGTTGTSTEGASSNSSSGKYALGVEGAIAIANTSAVASTSSTNFTGGVFLDWKLSDMFTFRPELLYVATGPDFLTLPLMFAWKPDTGSSIFKPYVFAGPEVGFRVSSAVGVGTFNAAIAGGGGLDIWVTPQFSIGANARYSFGFINLATAPADMKTRNIFLLATVGYQL